ncbi:hypothetical protein BGX34_000748, partial [Mortierella sp. NVP85]
MSTAPTDLDALRAAALMSRKQFTQSASITQPALDPALAPAPAIAAASPSTGEPSSTGFDQHAIPGLGWTQPAIHPNDPFQTSVPRSSPDIPAGPDVGAALEAADREDGEISDDDTTRRPASSDPSVDQASEHIANLRTSMADASNMSLSRPPSLQYSQEKHPGYNPRTKILTVMPPSTAHGAGSRSKTRSVDSGLTWVEQEADFSTLMEQYQLQRAKDTRPQPMASATEQEAISEIPGLGQIKSQGRSYMGPGSSERHTRSFSSYASYHTESPRPSTYTKQRYRKS